MEGRRKTNLEERMGVEFNSILKPGDVWTRNALSHAVEGQFAAQNVLGFEVGSVHHTSALSAQMDKCFPNHFSLNDKNPRHNKNGKDKHGIVDTSNGFECTFPYNATLVSSG